MGETTASIAEDIAPEQPRQARIASGMSGVDGRTRWARRYKELAETYAADIGEPSGMQVSLIARAASLTVELERSEASFAEAGKSDPETLAAYRQTTEALRRTLESLGLRDAPERGRSGGKTIEGTADRGGFVRWDEYAQANGIGVGDTDPATLVHARSGEEMTDNEFVRRVAHIMTEASIADAKGEPITGDAARVFQLMGFTPQSWRDAYTARWPRTTFFTPKLEPVVRDF
ncbi:hypothetical protein [Mesorhizobium australicum]|uniref:Uncharacterized protein n=1 Tax=Mesorhizobium australicum TaxID=536018 RepID=A0A1X7NEF4_9HYPH|nr:hypothetical protein [Mesorhizobium australicum]SMH36077.1 hypothetical protein SAMN02982922_1688 [Mesorhizobium australicum]